MKNFSKNFRENLREVREINAIISYYENDKYLILATESEENLTTENSDFIVTQNLKNNLSGESIIRINPSFNVDLFKSVCKSLEAEVKNKIPINTKINVRVGVKVNGKYEYLDYGNYFVRECSYQADSQTYLIIAYDKMYQSMISYDDNDANITYPISIKNLLIKICNYLKWDYNFDTFVNQNKIINKDLFKGQGLTYRDILDNISQVIVGNLMFDDKDNLIVKYINNLSENDIEVNEHDLRNINVEITEKYGIVNALLITTNGNVVLNNKSDNTSIQKNGKTELKINDNYILINNSDDFINDMFDKINGLEYYIYDVDTIGVLVLDPLDRFNIKINDTTYSTLMLNDDTQIDTGIVEKCYADKPELNVSEYKPTNANENKLNNAIIGLDKANAEIVMKVTSDGKLAQVRLDGDASDGSVVEIQADNINMKGVVTAINNGTTTINGDKITTGTITANQVSSDIITTTNFSAQNINASKITSGTLSTDRLESKVITTDNFSAQNINADKITAGTLSAASVKLKNVSLTPTSSKIGGWTINASQLLSANSTGNSTINSNGEIYFYPTKGGILALNNAFRCKAPSGIAIYNDKPNYGTSDNINAGISIMGDSGNVTIGNRSSAYGVNIRSYISSSTVADVTNGGMLLAAANDIKLHSNNNNIYMDAVNGAIWAHGNGLSNSKVKTDAGSSSSRNVKTNFKKFNQDKYDKALSLLNKMNLYDYDYKYNIYKNPHQYGFIIDELEQLEETKDFFEFEEYNATIKDDKIDFSGAMEGEKLKTKNYDSDVLDKYLLTCIKALLNKVEVLENKIKEMEEIKC